MSVAELSIVQIIEENIRSIPDFPKPGIIFKDITPILNDHYLLEATTRMLVSPFLGEKIDHVAGLESRGFLFGTNVAQSLHAGFIPIRKPGKLPSETISIDYELEYGTDSLEIHSDALKNGANVVIHDDLIATGGSAKAATDLIEKLGGNIVGYSFIIEIENLNGKNRLKQNVPFHSIIKV